MTDPAGFILEFIDAEAVDADLSTEDTVLEVVVYNPESAAEIPRELWVEAWDGRGQQGLPGEPGPEGPQGPQGEQGPPGPVAVESVNGSTGIVVLDASDIGSIPAGSVAAANVQDAIAELDAEKASTSSVTMVSDGLAAHIADPADAHAASAIGFTPTGTLVATDAQAALEELDSEKATTGSVTTVANDLASHLADAADAHDASAISFAPTGAIVATDVQAAVAELDSEKASTGSVTTVSDDLAAHIADAADAHDASAISYAGSATLSATDVEAAIDELDAEKSPALKVINAQTGTNYGLVLADADAFITMTNAAASTLTVPLNSTQAFAVGTVIECAQLGAGLVTITPTGGVTINGAPGLKSAGQYSTFGLLKLATNTWLAYGRLAA